MPNAPFVPRLRGPVPPARLSTSESEELTRPMCPRCWDAMIWSGRGWRCLGCG